MSEKRVVVIPGGSRDDSVDANLPVILLNRDSNDAGYKK